MIQAGDTIGPYTLIRPLGRGAFGEVWLAERRSSLITTQVALKLPLDGAIDIEVIRQEANLWLRAGGHPNVVPVLDAEVYKGQVVIASEYVAGGSLESWLEDRRGEPQSVDDAVAMATGILAGLQHLHDQQLIHRDLKPDNILLQAGIPRLTDFGLTRVLKPDVHSTSISGTPAYMSPEAFRGLYSPASDVWSAGVLLHVMMTGSLPFTQSDFYPLLLEITGPDAVSLSGRIPESLRPVLAKALAKPIVERFQSAREMSDALRASLSERSPQTATGEAKTVASGPLHNLPVQTSSFIGRTKEIEDIKALFSKTRLLTLTGSGGTGKTRLALRVADELVDRYEDGVWLVEFAAVASPDLIPQAIANVLQVQEQPGHPISDSLADALRQKSLLLVLDNCEHVLDTVARLSEYLLRLCPGLTLLTSSREALGIPGELTYRIPSLGLPPATISANVAAEVIRDFESVSLFVDRASLVGSGFALSDTNAATVARLCTRLDGIPLALELAAARVRMMPVEQIEARLNDRFRLLTGGSRNALPRQQTLRALIDWSYDLLDDREKSLLLRLSVFSGGCTLEAAEQVCAAEEGIEAEYRIQNTEFRSRELQGGHKANIGDAAIPSESCILTSEFSKFDILDLITALVDKSLLMYEHVRGEYRYRLLETVRQYARDRLADVGQSETYRLRHRDYFLALAQEAKASIIGPEQTLWLKRLDHELENLRSALDFCRESPESAQHGLLFGVALQEFWWIRGYLSEGRERLAALLNRPEAQAPTKARAGALNGAGGLALFQTDCAAARPLYEESLAIYRLLENNEGIANVLNNLGNVAQMQGNHPESRPLYEESLKLYREQGNKPGTAHALCNLGSIAFMQSEYPEAVPLYEQSLAIWRELGNKQGIANILNNLGSTAQMQGDNTTARPLFEESLELMRELGNNTGLASTLGNLGTIASDLNDTSSATSYFAECLALCREVGARYEATIALESCANLLRAHGRLQEAGRIFGGAAALRADIGSHLSPVEQQNIDEQHELLKAALPSDEYAAALIAGQSMSFDAAIAFALDELSALSQPH